MRFIALDDDGVPAEGAETSSIEVNKTNNSAPYILVDAEPGSGNIELAETLTFNASDSYDPEGGELSFNWSTSSDNAIITSEKGIAVVTFTSPGIYTVSLEASDRVDRNPTILRK